MDNVGIFGGDGTLFNVDLLMIFDNSL